LFVLCGVVSLTLLPARAQQEAPNTSGPSAADLPKPSLGTEIGAPIDFVPRFVLLPSESTVYQFGQAFDALQKDVRTVLGELANIELSGSGIHVEARLVRLGIDPETRPDSMAIELNVSLIPADKDAARPDWKSVGAFLKHWADTVNAHGANMTVEQIKMAPADEGNGVDLDVVVAMQTKESFSEAVSDAAIQRLEIRPGAENQHGSKAFVLNAHVAHTTDLATLLNHWLKTVYARGMAIEHMKITPKGEEKGHDLEIAGSCNSPATQSGSTEANSGTVRWLERLKQISEDL